MEEKEYMLRIAGIMRESVVDGPGIRYVVFTQGCPHGCPGCHNPQTHDFSGGSETDIRKIAAELDKDPLLAGVTFSGGEPFCQTAPLALLGDMVKERGLDLMLYSGFTYEQLLEMAESDEGTAHLLQIADKLVDGPFILAERDLTLQYMGSRNQRYIDLVRSREEGSPVKFTDDKWNVFSE